MTTFGKKSLVDCDIDVGRKEGEILRGCFIFTFYMFSMKYKEYVVRVVFLPSCGTV